MKNCFVVEEGALFWKTLMQMGEIRLYEGRNRSSGFEEILFACLQFSGQIKRESLEIGSQQ